MALLITNLDYDVKTLEVMDLLTQAYGYEFLELVNIEFREFDRERDIFLAVGFDTDESGIDRLKGLIEVKNVCFVRSQEPGEPTGFQETDGSKVLVLSRLQKKSVIAREIATSIADEYKIELTVDRENHIEPKLGSV